MSEHKMPVPQLLSNISPLLANEYHRTREHLVGVLNAREWALVLIKEGQARIREVPHADDAASNGWASSSLRFKLAIIQYDTAMQEALHQLRVAADIAKELNLNVDVAHAMAKQQVRRMPAGRRSI